MTHSMLRAVDTDLPLAATIEGADFITYVDWEWWPSWAFVIVYRARYRRDDDGLWRLVSRPTERLVWLRVEAANRYNYLLREVKP